MLTDGREAPSLIRPPALQARFPELLTAPRGRPKTLVSRFYPLFQELIKPSNDPCPHILDHPGLRIPAEVGFARVGNQRGGLP